MSTFTTRKFGMPTLIEISSLDETVQLCKELGLDFIELNMNLPQYQVEQLENIEYLEQLASKNDIYYTIHLDENLNVSDFNHAVARGYQQTVIRAIEEAKRLRIPVLNMHMNHGVHFTLPNRKVQLFEQYKDEYMKSMITYRSRCEEAIGNADIKICIENTDGYQSYEKEAITMLLQSGVFALTWDIGHSHESADVDEDFILKNKNKLSHFHIHDAVGKKSHMTLGTGEIDLEQRLHIAQKLGCRCVIETKTAAALRQSVEWLKND